MTKIELQKALNTKLAKAKMDLMNTTSWKRKNDLKKYIRRLQKEINLRKPKNEGMVR